MKFKCEQNILTKGINSVISGIAQKRNTILEGILITANENQLILNTYNEEIGMKYTINTDIVETGSIVVQATTFADIIRRLPDTEINIFVDKENNLLNIECEGSNYKLATMKPEEFPKTPEIKVENTLKIPQMVLKKIIKQTIFAAGTDEKRKLYTGCLLDVDNNSLNIVAVDGFRLAIRSAEAESDTKFKMVVPAKTLNELSKILNESFDEVEIGTSNNQSIFKFDNNEIYAKLLDGEFLNYRSLINGEAETKVIIDRERLTESFERLILISASNQIKEQKEPVDINVEIGKLILTCQSGVGLAKEEILVNSEGKEIKLKFNPKFFLDVLRNISEEEILIKFGTSQTPTIIKNIKDGDDYSYIILAVKTRD